MIFIYSFFEQIAQNLSFENNWLLLRYIDRTVAVGAYVVGNLKPTDFIIYKLKSVKIFLFAFPRSSCFSSRVYTPSTSQWTEMEHTGQVGSLEFLLEKCSDSVSVFSVLHEIEQYNLICICIWYYSNWSRNVCTFSAKVVVLIILTSAP